MFIGFVVSQIIDEVMYDLSAMSKESWWYTSWSTSSWSTSASTFWSTTPWRSVCHYIRMSLASSASSSRARAALRIHMQVLAEPLYHISISVYHRVLLDFIGDGNFRKRTQVFRNVLHRHPSFCG